MIQFGHKSDPDKEQRDMIEEEQFQEKYNALLGYIKTDEQTETYYNGHLMVVGTHLTQVCHSTGASPKQVVATYAEVMQELGSWFHVLPVKEKLEQMLDEKIWSKWSPKEQPVESMYTPNARKFAGNNTKRQQDP
ncbi:MAG: hypothetical protein SVY53_04850 [Chloroflexota bacterium]|nr:hypothetical protein [Chloroflexota bacterium]